MMCKADDIQEVRQGILDDLMQIAARYKPLQADYPDQYKDHAIAEMRKYVGSLLEHPTYRKFCQMMQLNQDEFASNILDDAIKAIT